MRLPGWPFHVAPPKTRDYTQNLRRYKSRNSLLASRSGLTPSFDTSYNDDIASAAVESLKTKCNDIPDTLAPQRLDRFVIDLFDSIGKDMGGNSDIFNDGLTEKISPVKIGRIALAELQDGIHALGAVFRRRHSDGDEARDGLSDKEGFPRHENVSGDTDKFTRVYELSNDAEACSATDSLSGEQVANMVFDSVGRCVDNESLEHKEPQSSIQSDLDGQYYARKRKSLSASDILKALRGSNVQVFRRINR